MPTLVYFWGAGTFPALGKCSVTELHPALPISLYLPEAASPWVPSWTLPQAPNCILAVPGSPLFLKPSLGHPSSITSPGDQSVTHAFCSSQGTGSLEATIPWTDASYWLIPGNACSLVMGFISPRVGRDIYRAICTSQGFEHKILFNFLFWSNYSHRKL